jgi:DNA-directed RNA polymerase subunit alpha
VLLSSLEGTAITSFKINGAMHEFSTLPNVKEDLVELILNLKNVRLKSYSNNEAEVLRVKVKGEKVVTVADIEKNAQVEIINKDQLIATLTDKSAELDLELTVQKGKGYVTVEDRSKEKVNLGVIMIDSLFSPVINVGFEVEHVRVGERTDYDKLVLKIETDGSLTPEEALRGAADILVEHFNFIKSQETEGAGEKALAKDKRKPDKEEKEEIKETAEEKPKKKRGRPKKSAT